MQTKALRNIQTVAKVLKVLAKIAEVFCIVGACFTAVGLVCVAVFGLDGSFQIGKVTIKTLLDEEHLNMNLPSLYASLACGVVVCVVGAILSHLQWRYLKHELADGTPFTERGAKELTRVGVLTIVLPVATAILCGIGIGVYGFFVSESIKVKFGGGSTIGTGLLMLLLAQFCRHGAEVEAQMRTASPAAQPPVVPTTPYN